VLVTVEQVDIVREKTLNTNLASEFYVASQLLRLGHTVTLTIGHTKEIDLIVAHQDGRLITIDVKGLKNTTNWPLQPKLADKTHFFVLVCYRNHFDDLSSTPEVFVIPSSDVGRLLTPWAGRPEVTAVAYRRIKDTKYKDHWGLLFDAR
jgi:hypothetical protein